MREAAAAPSSPSDVVVRKSLRDFDMSSPKLIGRHSWRKVSSNGPRLSLGRGISRATRFAQPGRHLLQLCVLFFGRFENRHIRIGIFPDCKEVLIGGLRFRRVPLQGISAAETQMSQRIEHIGGGNSAMVENFLVFGAGFLCVVRAEKRFAANIVGILTRAWRFTSKSIRDGGFCLRDGLRGLIPLQTQQSLHHGKAHLAEQSIGRELLGKIVDQFLRPRGVARSGKYFGSRGTRIRSVRLSQRRGGLFSRLGKEAGSGVATRLVAQSL